MALVLVTEAPTGDAFPIGPVKNAKAVYDKCVKELSKSETANTVLEALKHSPKKVGVLIFTTEDAGEDDFVSDSAYIPPHIPWGAAYDGGLVVLNVTMPMWIQKKQLPLGVSLLHECGHAKQFLDNSKRFTKYYNIAKTLDGKKSKKIKAEAARLHIPEDKAATLAIENENIQLYEKPTLEQLGLPFREKYD
jgi:hypothetical protein